jgi:predicted dithiol-disulfide oxidoreductase (DUF899 family)
MTTSIPARPTVVSRDDWLVARRALLVKEKQLTRAYDELCALRRQLPWVRVDKEYRFDGPNGTESLGDLFGGRSQLIIRHFMFGPGWKEGCVGCSFASDHVGGALVHLEHHDVTYVAVSRAPLADIEAFKNRMGWIFKWVSSSGSDFNYDFHVSFREDEVSHGRVFYNFERRVLPFVTDELSGVSVFYRDPTGDIYHTYSCFARGDEGGLTTYFYLDLTPNGRNETGPHHNLGDWVRHHDRYEAGKAIAASRRRAPPPPGDRGDAAGAALILYAGGEICLAERPARWKSDSRYSRWLSASCLRRGRRAFRWTRAWLPSLSISYLIGTPRSRLRARQRRRPSRARPRSWCSGGLGMSAR